MIVAVLVPVFVIALIIYLYHRKHGHYPSLRRKRVTNGPTRNNLTAPWSRRRAVWRPEDPEEGLPGYTMEAKDGELSLGIGRKRAVEERDLTEAIERSIRETRESRTGSVITTATGRTEVTTPPPAEMGAEELPPYIPPPPPPAVLLKGGYLFGRAGSRQSVGSASRMTS